MQNISSTPSPTATTTPVPGGLNTGAKVGIGVGAGCACIISLASIWFIYAMSRRRGFEPRIFSELEGPVTKSYEAPRYEVGGSIPRAYELPSAEVEGSVPRAYELPSAELKQDAGKYSNLPDSTYSQSSKTKSPNYSYAHSSTAHSPSYTYTRTSALSPSSSVKQGPGTYSDPSKHGIDAIAPLPAQISATGQGVDHGVKQTLVQEHVILDQPMDDDAILGFFDSADDMLSDHIQNYYIPEQEVSLERVEREFAMIPEKDLAMILERNVLLKGRAVYLFRAPRMRACSLRAIAAFYLYSALADNAFLPASACSELEEIKTLSEPSDRQRQRIVMYHRLTQDPNYSSLLSDAVSEITVHLYRILSAFLVRGKVSSPTLQYANLRDVVQRFASLGYAVGKQQAVYKAELRLEDFSSAEVGEAKKCDPGTVAYVNFEFNPDKMKAIFTEKGEGRMVGAVVVPGIRKYSAPLKTFQSSQLIRPARVVIL